MSKSLKPAQYSKACSSIEARLEGIKTKVEALAVLTTPLTPVQTRKLAAYLAEAHAKRNEFEALFRRVLDLTEDEAKGLDLDKDQETIMELSIDVVSAIEALTPDLVPASPVAPNPPAGAGGTAASPAMNVISLPKLTLKTFSGDPKEWVTFYNMFNTTIHNSLTLAAVVKMQYLLGSLSGEPLSMIKSLPISAQNYITAYDLLKARYHNPRRLKMLHLNALLWTLPAIRLNSVKDWRSFLNIYNENVQALDSLDCSLSGSNPFLSAFLMAKFDSEMLKKLETHRLQNDCEPHSLPTPTQILEFLTFESDLAEDAKCQSSTSATRRPRSPPHLDRSYKNYSARTHKNVTLFSREGSISHSQPSHGLSISPSPVGSCGPGNMMTSRKIKCFCCQSADHRIYTCPKFESLSPQERSRQVRRLHRCVSCLGNHDLTTCTSQSTCRTCQKRHHTLLHYPLTPAAVAESHAAAPDQRSLHTSSQQSQDRPQPSLPPKGPLSNNSSSHVALPCASQTDLTTVLLGTTLVHVTAANGHSQVLRGLIDSGSTSSFLSEHAAQILRAPREPSHMQVTGIDVSASRTRGLVRLDLSGLNGDVIVHSHPLHILETISVPLPRATITPEVVQLTKKYLLADPSFHMPGPIDLLLGADLFPLLLSTEWYSLGPNLPTMLGTRLGFVVIGQAPCVPAPSQAHHLTPHHAIALLSTGELDLHDSLSRFWTMEEPPQASSKSLEESLCDAHFARTHSRTPEGRYCVSLPFKAEHSPLGASLAQAGKRFFALERKFKADPQFAQLYHSFMLDYESRGHMTKVTALDLTSPHYFLPHHGILKGSGNAAKIRVVFDASAKTNTGTSLNDIMLTGPKLQADICKLLLKFRSHRFAFTCDIEQMYRQINVTPDHQKFQLILWRSSPSLPLDTYKLNTVTYGTSCAPYLALKTLQQLAADEGHQFPEAAAILQEDTYVDDIISGADTLPDAQRLQQRLINLLQCGGFVLKKWTANHPDLLHSFPADHLGLPSFLDKTSQAPLSVLGLRWSPSSDYFVYDLNLPREANTKRQILSLIAQIYDPCGFLSPVTMRCKLFMQLLWSLGLSWDAPLPADHLEKWQTLHKELPLLSQIKVSRPLSTTTARAVELHGYSDASEGGYSAVLYVRCVYPDDTVSVHLVLAKTRVAPLKKVTLPRLELCGAHLLAQLTRYVLTTLSTLNFTSHHLWCDSSVVLAWIRTPPHRLKTFVANRVAQIVDWVPAHYFQHVQGILNPADCASRGIPPSQLKYHPLWWSGPPWLHIASSSWLPSESLPAPSHELPPLAAEELKTTPLTAFLSTLHEDWDFLSRYSSWDRLQRILAYVLRFAHNCRRRPPQGRQIGPLSAAELLASRLKIIQLVQQRHFTEDIAALQRQAPPSQRLRRLSPFLDTNGLLRVGGRLTHSPLSQQSKHPLILPKDHCVVDLIIDSCHQQLLHAGPQLTQATLAQEYWILSARSKIRSRIFKCLTCFRQRPRFSPPLMADLPSVRVTPSKPFASTGIDYAGPFTAKILNLRSIRTVKVYLCIFICMATKAVHLEIVTDLTTEAFLAALTRFISRRGRCSDIYSDCGSNFLGAASELSAIVKALKSPDSQELISRTTAPLQIRFHFNPPSAPHFGGLWESAVKSAKHHLKRVMGDHVLTLPELITLATRVEAMLNSRPLTPLSSDPSDLAVLTPGHFLTGEPLVAVPETNWQDTPIDRLRGFQLVQALQQRLWNRWKTEYLHTLQHRPKWTAPQRDLQVGDLVLISSPSPPLSWPVGRVSELHPGADGTLRVVDVTTPRGTYRRPVVKLARLPLDA